MKRNYMLIILASAILGIFLGSILREHSREKENYISKDSLTKKEIRTSSKSIKSLKKEKEKLEEEYEKLKAENEEMKDIEAVNAIKEKLSYTDIKGSGVIIKMDASSEDIGNIANFVDYNKLLIKMINDLKLHGGEYISINDQRINQYSEITLAGSHININSTPIAPPYEIKCIGEKIPKEYISDLEKYLDGIENNYPLKIEAKVADNIELKKMNVPNKLKHIEGE